MIHNLHINYYFVIVLYFLRVIKFNLLLEIYVLQKMFLNRFFKKTLLNELLYIFLKSNVFLKNV